MAEKAVNDFATQLDGAINATTTNIVVDVAAPAGLQGGEFRVRIDDELILITGGQDGTAWVGVRGVEGTTAAAHANNRTVTHVLTDASFDLLVDQLVSTAVDAEAAARTAADTALTAADAALEAAIDAHTGDLSAAHAASAVSFNPTGTVASTDVQAAIAEVVAEAGGRIVDVGGNTGNSVTLDTDGDPLVVFRNATLHPSSGNVVAFNFTDLAAGKAQRVWITGLQDGTGGRTITINDGTGAVAFTPSPAPDAPFEVFALWDGTDLNVDLAGVGPDASTTVKGLAKLSVAPVSAASPVAVGDNDPRVPTTGQRDALAGTAGTPGTGNEYVTRQDRDAHLNDTTDAHDASAISIVDAGGYFTGADVETALQEVGAGAGGGTTLAAADGGSATSTYGAAEFIDGGAAT